MSHLKVDKLKRYKIALCINGFVGFLQLLVLIFLANSLALFGDMMHSIADTLILAGTVYVIGHEINDSSHDHVGAKKILVWVAVGLLWVSAVYVGFEAIDRIEHPVGFPGWPVAILALLSGIGNFFAHKVVSGVAIKEQDHMHKVNIAHLITDGVLSVIVLISAVLNIVGVFASFDAWVSLLIVAPWMAIWGWKILFPPKHDHHDHHH